MYNLKSGKIIENQSKWILKTSEVKIYSGYFDIALRVFEWAAIATWKLVNHENVVICASNDVVGEILFKLEYEGCSVCLFVFPSDLV